MGELMDKIIGSEENWEEGRLGLDEENQVAVDQTVEMQVDTSIHLWVWLKLNLKSMYPLTKNSKPSRKKMD